MNQKKKKKIVVEPREQVSLTLFFSIEEYEHTFKGVSL
jgi:hypothetical protein